MKKGPDVGPFLRTAPGWVRSHRRSILVPAATLPRRQYGRRDRGGYILFLPLERPKAVRMAGNLAD